MSKLIVPEGYTSPLTVYETQRAIEQLRLRFVGHLTKALNLCRASAPLFVAPETGLNDDLNGVERPVEFDIPATGGRGQIVQSLAKWKRYALGQYGFSQGEGLYTEMNAVRRDEELDNLHSVYVDQWDWEKVISPDQRNLDYLRQTVEQIVDAICTTQEEVLSLFPQLGKDRLSRQISFVTTQELEDLYPELSPKQREERYVKEHPTTFLMQIGGPLKSGQPHDGRAPDYDDWQLNGDILFWNPVLQCAHEISSMGIRVDRHSLDRQLTLSGQDGRRVLPFHKMLLEGRLPLTMGGGIGQSRLCMLLLRKAHIGEVQVSIWDQETAAGCKKAGITLL